jgi:dTDP-4-dehydrorhamnose reductase
MKRVLVLGGTGMLGHKLCQIFGPTFETYATFRAAPPSVPGVFDLIHPIEGVVAEDFASVASAIRKVKPAYVINAIGVVKQRREATEAIPSITLNALFPHQVAAVCREESARLVQVSTDCVFSGLKGAYTETDVPDPVDLYGRSKLLGEVDDGSALTLRTSIIGRELRAGLGLVEWFLGQSGGNVRGFANAIYSGLTTQTLCNIIARIVDAGSLHGIWHVSSEAVTKYDLLVQLNEAFGAAVTIARDEEFHCDRSLVSDPFWRETGLSRPTWPDMLRVLVEDRTPYPSSRVRAVR